MYRILILFSILTLALICIHLDHELYKTQLRVQELKKEDQYWQAKYIASLVMFGDDASAKQAISSINDPEVERRVIKQIWEEYNEAPCNRQDQSDKLRETARSDEHRYWRLKSGSSVEK